MDITIKKSKNKAETIQWNENKPWHEAFLDCLNAYLKLERVQKASRWGETARRKKIAMKFQTLLKQTEGKTAGEIYTQHYLNYHFLQNQKDVQVKPKEAFHDPSHLGTLLAMAHQKYRTQATKQLNLLIEQKANQSEAKQDKLKTETEAKASTNPFDDAGPLTDEELAGISAKASSSHDQSAKIKKLEADIEKLTPLAQENAELNKKILKLEQEKQRLAEALKSQKQQSQASHGKKDAEIEGKLKEIERLHEELKKKEDELARKQDELKPLQDKLQSKKGQIAELNKREQQIIDEKNGLSKKNAASETKIAQQKTVIKNLSSEKNAAKAKVDELNKQVETLKQEKLEIEKELKSAKEFNMTHEDFKKFQEDKVKQLEEQIGQLRLEKKKNEQSIKQLTEERNNLEQQNGEQKQEIEKTTSENVELKRTNEDQTETLRAMQSELRELKKQHESLKKQYEKLDTEYSNLKGGVASLASRNATLQGQLENKNIEIANLKRENNELKNQVNGLVKLFKATWRYFIDFLKDTCDKSQNNVIPKTCISRFLNNSDRTESNGNILLPTTIDNALDKQDKVSINETDALNPRVWERAAARVASAGRSFLAGIFGGASSSEKADGKPAQGEFEEIPLDERSGLE